MMQCGGLKNYEGRGEEREGVARPLSAEGCLGYVKVTMVRDLQPKNKAR